MMQFNLKRTTCLPGKDFAVSIQFNIIYIHQPLPRAVVPATRSEFSHRAPCTSLIACHLRGLSSLMMLLAMLMKFWLIPWTSTWLWLVANSSVGESAATDSSWMRDTMSAGCSPSCLVSSRAWTEMSSRTEASASVLRPDVCPSTSCEENLFKLNDLHYCVMEKPCKQTKLLTTQIWISILIIHNPNGKIHLIFNHPTTTS